VKIAVEETEPASGPRCRHGAARYNATTVPASVRANAPPLRAESTMRAKSSTTIVAQITSSGANAASDVPNRSSIEDCTRS